jgi:tetratricopeptide (TPR) repeat protein
VAAADTDGNQYLPEAIAAYERGIAREPHFAYNKANLASLYWQAGLGEEAIDLMKQALEALPREPLFHLNLGYYAELSGDTEQAVREYTRFLSGNAHLARASFWRQTPLRRSLLQEGQDTFLMARRPSSPQSYRDYVTVAWREYEDGHIEQAEAYFEHARTINPALPDAYRGLAQVNLQLGHLAEAQCLAKKALFLGDASEPHFILGRSAYLQGYLPRAIDEYVLALTEYFYAGKYGLLIFHRDFIQAPELLPQLIQLNFTDYHATRSVELAQLYEEAGASQRAMQVYQMVLEYDPTFESALEGLERLGGT